MANNIIEINTATLRNDVQSIQAELRGLHSTEQQLREAADSLGATWEGPAKNAFMNAFREDLAHLEELIKEVESFTNLTDESRTEYEKCESAVSQIVNSIRV